MEKKIRGYEIDFTTNTLYMNYKFAEAANIPKSKEYLLVAEIRKDFPKIKIITRAGRNAKTCNANKRLTYANMESYIKGQTEMNVDELLYLFELTKIESKCAKSPYAFVRDWFVKQFPNYKECKILKDDKIIPFAEAAPQEDEEKVS